MQVKLKTLLVINAVILGTSGIFAVLVPARVCSLYGVPINPGVVMMAQYAGLGSIAIAVFAWFSKGFHDTQVRRGITLAFFIIHTLGAIISFQNMITDAVTLGWAIFVLYALLAAGYAYFSFSGRATD